MLIWSAQQYNFADNPQSRGTSALPFLAHSEIVLQRKTRSLSGHDGHRASRRSRARAACATASINRCPIAGPTSRVRCSIPTKPQIESPHDL